MKKMTSVFLSKSTLALAICSILPGAFAYATTPAQSSIKLKEPNYFYANAGGGYEFLNLPRFRTAAISVQNKPQTPFPGIQLDKGYPYYNLALGYQFRNDSFLSSIFGHSNRLEFDFSQVKASATNAVNSFGGINFYNINGSGYSFDQTERYAPQGIVFHNSLLRAHADILDEQLNFIGNDQLGSSSNWTMQPSIGLRRVYSRQDYNFVANIDQAPIDVDYTQTAQDVENYTFQTTYRGIKLADEFKYHPQTSHFGFKGGLNTTIFQTTSVFHANQNNGYGVVGSEMFQQYVSNVIHKISADMGAKVAVSYYFKPTPTSASVSLVTTLDYWTLTPEIIQAYATSDNLANGVAATITGKPMWTRSIGLEFTAPLVF